MGNINQGLQRHHLIIFYVVITGLLTAGVLQRWHAASTLPNLNAESAAVTSAAWQPPAAQAPPPSSTALRTSATDATTLAERQAYYERLLGERDALARQVTLHEQSPIERFQSHLDWFNALPQEQRTPEISAAIPKVAFGLTPLEEAFAKRPDDWHFNEEEHFFTDFYQQIQFDDNQLAEHLSHFACTSSHCELQFDSLPEPLFRMMQAEFEALGYERLRHHPYLSISIGSSPSNSSIRFSIGRKL